jgi:hypothetical protein
MVDSSRNLEGTSFLWDSREKSTPCCPLIRHGALKQTSSLLTYCQVRLNRQRTHESEKFFRLADEESVGG